MPLSAPAPSLELSRDELQSMGEEVLSRVVEHLSSLREQHCADQCDDIKALCRRLREPTPETGSALTPLLDQLFDELIPTTYSAEHPGFLAYVPGGGVYTAALADLIANTVNRFTGIWDAAPALVQLEANSLDWMRDWMGMPASTRGVYTTGGSMAAFLAIACARDDRLGKDFRDGTLYVSTQSHNSIIKAAKLAGIAADRVRIIATDADYRIRLDALEEAIAADRAAGFRPFMVVSNSGTTNTGAVDCLAGVADIAAQQGLWHHVDGAYGAFFRLVPELAPSLDAIARADSVTLDPHKGLFLPYGTGALLVRDAEALRRLNSSTGDYLPASQQEFYDPAQFGPNLSRDFPGLRVWMTLKYFGLARYRGALAEKRRLALDACERLAAVPGLVIDAPPQLSAFAFHLEQAGRDSNELTRELLDRVNRRGQIMLAGTSIDGRYLGRICVLGMRTHQQDIDTCIQQLTEEALLLTQTEG